MEFRGGYIPIGEGFFGQCMELLITQLLEEFRYLLSYKDSPGVEKHQRMKKSTW